MTHTENFTSISSTDILNQLKPKLNLFENKTVWAIGGGKGGVGKSFLSANIAIELASSGSRVLAIDLDLGGANLHTCLGVPIPELTLSDFFSKKILDISEIITKTNLENLSLISGAQDEIGMANLRSEKKNFLLSALKDLEFDYIIFDLGAGTSLNTLDFFISADLGILVTLPEPTSIENTYRFLRSCFYRKIQNCENYYKISHLFKEMCSGKINDSISSPSELLTRIKEVDVKIYQEIKSVLNGLNYNLVINQVRTQSESELGSAIEKICIKYFGIPVKYMGKVSYDPAVWQSVRTKESLLKAYPNSNSAHELKKLVSNLYNKELQ